MKKNLLLLMLGTWLCVVHGYAQNRTVTGKVTAESDGSPLPGVNVLLKGQPISGRDKRLTAAADRK